MGAKQSKGVPTSTETSTSIETTTNTTSNNPPVGSNTRIVNSSIKNHPNYPAS